MRVRLLKVLAFACLLGGWASVSDAQGLTRAQYAQLQASAEQRVALEAQWQALVPELMDFARQQTGYNTNIPMPTIRLIPRCELIQLERQEPTDICRQSSQVARTQMGRMTFGAYDFRTQTIYLRDDLSPDDARHVLLHELVHHLQRHNGGGRSACLAREEEEAYRVQNLYARIHDLFETPQHWLEQASRCS